MKAFSTNSCCKLDFCLELFGIYTDKWNKEVKIKKRKVSKSGSGGSTAKSTGGETRGEYGHPTLSDLTGLTFMIDKNYLTSKRKESERGYKDIATTCSDYSMAV